MKNTIFMLVLLFITSLVLSGCLHQSEENNELSEPQVAQETDEIIPEAPEEESNEEGESEDTEVEGDNGQGGGIGGPLIEQAYVSGSLILDNFGSMQAISSPFTLTGRAPRSWFFEGVFPVTLMSLEGEIITASYASGEWLSPVGDSAELGADDMIAFSSNIVFSIPADSTGEAKLRFSKDNTNGAVIVEYVEELVILVD